MDLSNRQEPFIAERVMLNTRQNKELIDRVYEYRESPGVEALGKFLECQRDAYLLEALSVKATQTSPIEIAVIQGKIKAIGEVIATINQQFYVKNSKKKKPRTKKVRSSRQRKPTEAGAAI